MAPLVLLVPVVFADIESAKQSGNLTGVLTTLSSYLALTYLIPYYIAKTVATWSSHPSLSWDRCVFASVSALFLFVCVLTVWFALLVIPFGTPQGVLGTLLFCFAGVFSACVVAGYSHDWVLQQQTKDEPVDSPIVGGTDPDSLS
jgi:hypothetical protein